MAPRHRNPSGRVCIDRYLPQNTKPWIILSRQGSLSALHSSGIPLDGEISRSGYRRDHN